MTLKDLKQMKAIIEANNWTIRSQGRLNMTFDSVKVLCEAYNDVINALKQYGINFPIDISEINIDGYQDKENGTIQLVDLLYVKDALLQPLLVIEIEERNTNKSQKRFFDELSSDYNGSEDLLYILSSYQSLIDGYEKRIQEQLSEEEKDDLINEIEDSIDELTEWKDHLDEASSDAEDLIDELENLMNDIDR